MTSYKLGKLLMDKKLLDAFPFSQSCEFKLNSVEFNMQILEKYLIDFWTESDKLRTKISNELIQTGTSSISVEEKKTITIGSKIYSESFIINKLISEIYSALHSFFDIYAQWLNKALLAEIGLSVSNVNINDVVNKLNSRKNNLMRSKSPDFFEQISKIINNTNYKYIVDINNTMKHRQMVFSTTKFDLFSGDFFATLPPFEKDGRIYQDKDLVELLNIHLSYCKQLLNDSYDFIDLYYSEFDNPHISNRIHNPQIKVVLKEKKIINSIIFIEDSLLKSEYHFLLCRDIPDTESIEIFNCPYKIIAVFDPITKKYIALLEPSDNNSIALNDGGLIEYRKYCCKAITEDMFEFEINKEHTSSKQIFPLLSSKLEVILL